MQAPNLDHGLLSICQLQSTSASLCGAEAVSPCEHQYIERYFLGYSQAAVIGSLFTAELPVTTETVRDVLSCADMLHVRRYLCCGPRPTAPYGHHAWLCAAWCWLDGPNAMIERRPVRACMS